MPKYYAWSTIHVDRNEYGQAKKVVNPGDEVTADSLGVSKEEFQNMIESGSVRTQQYPDMPPGYTGSPLEYVREQAAAVENEAVNYGDVVEAETLSPPAQAPPPGDVK